MEHVDGRPSILACHTNVGRRQSEQMKWGWRVMEIGDGDVLVKHVGHSHAGFRFSRFRANADDLSLLLDWLL